MGFHANELSVNTEIGLSLGWDCALIFSFIKKEIGDKEQLKQYKKEDFDGYVQFSLGWVKEKTGFSYSKQSKVFKLLEDNGLIKSKVRGLPGVRFVSLGE